MANRKTVETYRKELEDQIQRRQNYMVRLQFRIIEKPYKKGLRIYKHEEVTLNFPKELHELLRVFCDKKLEIKGYTEGNKVHLILGCKEESEKP